MAWLRGARRRPARAGVVIATLALLVMGLSAALVAADALDALFIADAEAEWGDVDVEITGATDATFGEGLGRYIGVESDGLSPAWAPRLLLSGVARADNASATEVLVMGLGPEEQSYPALAATEGTGEFLRIDPGTVVLNQRAASRLGVTLGDEVSLVVAIPSIVEERPGREDRRLDPRSIEIAVRVSGVVADEGVADLHRTPNVLMRRDVLQRWTSLEGEVTHLHLSAVDRSEDAADAIIDEHDSLMRRIGLQGATVRVDQLTIAEDEGAQFRSLLLTLALLIVGAAVIAVTQLLTALAEDRSRELAVLSVHGVHRSTLVRLVVLEAVGYGVVAGVLGLLAGVPLANFVAQTLSDHFAQLAAGRGREQVALAATVSPAAIVTSVVVVIASAALTGRAAARRLLAVDLDELLRGPLTALPKPRLSERRPFLTALAGTFFLGLGVGGPPAADALRYLGLTLLLTAWWLRRRRGPDREHWDRRAAWAGLAWSTIGAALLADFSQGYEVGFGILVLAGVISVVSASVLLTSRFRTVMRGVRVYAPNGAWQAALRTAGAWAQESAGRTGRVQATFGVVLFLAVALHVLGNAAAVDVGRQSGGFHVMATSVAGVDDRELRNVEGLFSATTVAATTIPEDRFWVAPEDDEDARLAVRYPVNLVGIDGAFPIAQDFHLASADPAYATAGQALEAVVRDANKAVVDRYALPPGAAVGDDVVLDLGLGPERYELVAILDTFLLGAVFVAETEYLEMVPSNGPTMILAVARSGVASDDLAVSLETWGASIGVSAESMSEVAERIVSVNRTFTDVFSLMLLIGLMVGVVALGAMTFHQARERRQHLAVLRALGFRRRTVALAVASEPITVAAVGGVAGAIVGVAVLRVLFWAGFSDLAFRLDIGRGAPWLGGLLLMIVVVSWAVSWPMAPKDPSDALHEVG